MNPRAQLALLLAIVTLVTGLGSLTLRTGQGDTYELTAFFPRAIGLFPRSTVRVLGVEVGRVREVDPSGDRVRVVMDVRSDVRVPQDASAAIVPISLISDRYVQLSPVWRGGAFLRDGDEIPLERGVAPAELDDLLATLEDFLRAIEPGTADEPGALGRLVTNADRALDGRGAELSTTVESLATILDALGSNADDVESTIVSLDRLVAALARRDAALERTNRGLAAVFGALADERDALGRGVGNVADLLDELGRLVRTHRSALEADIDTLADTTQVLVDQQDRVLRNILWLPVLSEAVRKAFDEPNRRILVRDNQQVRGS